MKPLTITDRYRLRELKITPSAMLPKGKVIWWQGRKRLQFGTLDQVAIVPSGADGLSVSAEDHAELQAALYPPRPQTTVLNAG